jgi:hypothetical protein
MEDKISNLNKSFLIVLFRMMPLLGALVYKTLDLVFEKGDINYDPTMYILGNIFVWMMLISIINKTFLKYYLVGFYKNQYAIARKLATGKFVKVIIAIAAFINYRFFVHGVVTPYLMAAELILLIIADAAIEVKVRVYLHQEEADFDLERQYG